MARIRIVTDSMSVTYADSPGLTDTYINVPDDVWRDYLAAKEALAEAEENLFAFDRPENRVSPADEAESW